MASNPKENPGRNVKKKWPRMHIKRKNGQEKRGMSRVKARKFWPRAFRRVNITLITNMVHAKQEEGDCVQNPLGSKRHLRSLKSPSGIVFTAAIVYGFGKKSRENSVYASLSGCS